MKKLALALIAAGSLLSGCIGYEVEGRDRGINHADRDHDRMADRDRDRDHDRVRDRDRDGVPDRQDRRPDDPRRY